MARRDDFVHNPGTLESMWKQYVGHEECFVEDVDTGVDKPQLIGLPEPADGSPGRLPTASQAAAV